MKKTAIVLAIAAVSLATAAQAAPKDDSWYLGAKVGWSRFADTGQSNYIRDNYKVDNNKARADQLGAGGYVGYQANRYIGFELGYDWLGRMPYKADRAEKGTGAFKAHGLQLTAKLGIPITDSIDLYTRLGGMAWRADGRFHEGPVQNNRARRDYKKHDTGVSGLVAAGIEYALTNSLATRLDYQWIWNIGDDDTVGARPDNGMLSLGMAYRFGQDNPPVVIAPPIPPKVETKHFSLKSDVLFNFNKATLKSEGKTELDSLFAQVSNIAPTEGHIKVMGYTDRIGSEAYNKKLSQRRAQAVVDYMISKGVPADKISAVGLGKADPVTGSSCNNIKQRKALIECLAPDRRVEIDIVGSTDVVSK